MISCAKYSDAWSPFFALLGKYWPERSATQPWLLTDRYPDRVEGLNHLVYATGNPSWCGLLAEFAEFSEEPICLFQEDFFLNAPVRHELVDHALEQMKARNAGMVRLYPCPGADEDYGDPHFGIVKRGTPYRISCQASLWRGDYLHAIASRFDTPQQFELMGTRFAESLPDEVLAFKRDTWAWPIQYLCTAIVGGLWSRDAKRLCDREGIAVDWSRRGFQAA